MRLGDPRGGLRAGFAVSAQERVLKMGGNRFYFTDLPDDEETGGTISCNSPASRIREVTVVSASGTSRIMHPNGGRPSYPASK